MIIGLTCDENSCNFNFTFRYENTILLKCIKLARAAAIEFTITLDHWSSPATIDYFHLPLNIILKNLSKMMKELVEVASFYCFSSGGIFFDTMDSDNLIVNFTLRSRGFVHYRCDRDIIMDMDVNSLVGVLNYADDDDTITIKVDDSSNIVKFTIENPST